MSLRQSYWTKPIAEIAASRWCGIVADKLAWGRAALAAVDRQPAEAGSCTRRSVVASRIILQRLEPLRWELEALQSHVQLSRWLPEFNQLVDPVSAQLSDYIGALQASIDAADASVECEASDPNPLSTAQVAPAEFNDADASTSSAHPAPSASATTPADAEEALLGTANDLVDGEKLMTQVSGAEAVKIIAGVGPSSSTADDNAASQSNGRGMSKSMVLLQGSQRFAATVGEPACSVMNLRNFGRYKLLRTFSQKQEKFRDKTLADLLFSFLP